MSSPDQTFSPQQPAFKALPPTSYGKLRQRHPDYDASRMRLLDDFYRGGWRLQGLAERYLHKLCNEHDSRFSERCVTTAYLNYFGQVVGQFTSDLFAQPLSVMAPADADDPSTPGDPPDEFYKEFEKNSDLRGTAFVDLMKAAITTALVQRDAFISVDTKALPDSTGAENRASEEASGALRFYAYETNVLEVIDWKEDDLGGFEWVILNRREQERADPFKSRDRVRETFLIWRMVGEGAEARAAWDLYEIEYDADKTPKNEDACLRKAGGTTSFCRIPVLRLRLPDGLWVGNLVGFAQKEHWQKRSELNGATKRGLATIPVVARGPEIGPVGGAQPSESQEDPHRGRDPVGKFNREGFVETGAGDKVYFAEPEGKCYAIVQKDIDELKDEIFRVTHMMAASVRPSAGMMGRSAQSKQQDGKATALVLRALGQEVRKLALLVYRTISEARGDDDVEWVANGMDNYEVINRDEILAEAVQMTLIDIPSEVFAATHATQVAEKLLTGVDPMTLDTMRKEIQKGIAERFKQKKLEHEVKNVALEAAKDGPPEGDAPPGKGAPPGKPAAPPAKKPEADGARA